MKKFFSITILTLAVGLSGMLSSCKYEEGPFLSLKSRTERVSNTWQVESATDVDGNDKTSDYDGITWTLDTEGNFTVNGDLAGIPYSYSGNWEFSDSDANIRITYSYTVLGVSFSVDDESEILKLKEEEVWIKDLDDDRIELHLIPA